MNKIAVAIKGSNSLIDELLLFVVSTKVTVTHIQHIIDLTFSHQLHQNV